MPEFPEMQALAERVEEFLEGATFAGVDVLGFSSLKTVLPGPEQLAGAQLVRVDRRGKYLRLVTDAQVDVVLHLSQAGRLDIESPGKRTKPKGAAVRFRFDGDRALLVREFGHERKVAWWVLAAADAGPTEGLGPEVDSEAFELLVRTGADGRRIHTVLRDQRTVAGLGRGWTDDALRRAHVSPFASLKSLSPEARDRLLVAIRETLAEALATERTRSGGLSESKLGDRFQVHNRHGLPCPECGTAMRRVSYESHEITYCPQCQTGGKILADRRMSRLVK